MSLPCRRLSRAGRCGVIAAIMGAPLLLSCTGDTVMGRGEGRDVQTGVVSPDSDVGRRLVSTARSYAKRHGYPDMESSHVLQEIMTVEDGRSMVVFSPVRSRERRLSEGGETFVVCIDSKGVVEGIVLADEVRWSPVADVSRSGDGESSGSGRLWSDAHEGE